MARLNPMKAVGIEPKEKKALKSLRFHLKESLDPFHHLPTFRTVFNGFLCNLCKECQRSVWADDLGDLALATNNVHRRPQKYISELSG